MHFHFHLLEKEGIYSEVMTIFIFFFLTNNFFYSFRKKKFAYNSIISIKVIFTPFEITLKGHLSHYGISSYISRFVGGLVNHGHLRYDDNKIYNVFVFYPFPGQRINYLILEGYKSLVQCYLI